MSALACWSASPEVSCWSVPSRRRFQLEDRFLRLGVQRTSVTSREATKRTSTEQSVASPRVVAWRTRHLVGIMLAAGLVLAVLTLIASNADPNTLDLAATRWIQQFNAPAFAA